VLVGDDYEVPIHQGASDVPRTTRRTGLNIMRAGGPRPRAARPRPSRYIRYERCASHAEKHPRGEGRRPDRPDGDLGRLRSITRGQCGGRSEKPANDVRARAQPPHPGRPARRHAARQQAIAEILVQPESPCSFLYAAWHMTRATRARPRTYIARREGADAEVLPEVARASSPRPLGDSNERPIVKRWMTGPR